MGHQPSSSHHDCTGFLASASASTSTFVSVFFSRSHSSCDITFTLTSYFISPCSGGAPNCVDPSSFPSLLLVPPTEFTVSIRVWASAPMDVFVELHESSTGKLVSNYAYQSTDAAVTSDWVVKNFSVSVVGPLGNPPYNWFTWTTPSGAGWPGNTYQQVITVDVQARTTTTATSTRTSTRSSSTRTSMRTTTRIVTTTRRTTTTTKRPKGAYCTMASDCLSGRCLSTRTCA
ncbi:hypothetical protein M427DRAFT_199015 [Gonapodya prolifera JEL478]|uniref:Uncharacterized protein n=1 Tax=Gonapodya prolifera (strain JEL478) TaxID=1344416 RepID=A0A139APS4_GONPJ|nr:hypothetical protein M427DRAFT_199015 [Gonapodya prolifera JEL478]|eukprot:KXS18761.1 hypothetical protein M427DRAFT_199015 [Gonapodya prolifera JEL478]